MLSALSDVIPTGLFELDEGQRRAGLLFDLGQGEQSADIICDRVKLFSLYAHTYALCIEDVAIGKKSCDAVLHEMMTLGLEFLNPTVA